MLRAAFDTDTGDADLSYSGGRLVDDGYDVETVAINSLLSDAPAQEGDVLTAGTPRRGWFADVLDERGHIFGSRLWLLEGAEVTQASAERAKTYTAEALQWMVDDRLILGFSIDVELQENDIALEVDLRTRDGRTTAIGPFKLVSP